MDLISKISGIILQALVSSFDILAACFGLLLLLGLLLYLLARSSRNLFAKTLGPRAELYFSAWIGTPVHELGHAFFCVIFRHRITRVRLFTPNARDGSLGSVEHSYNRKNLYQRAGSFFIGAGPVIFGALVILALLHLLLPNGQLVAGQLHTDAAILKQDGLGIWQYTGAIVSGFANVVALLFTSTNLASWQFWIFLYLVMAVASHMELSPPDIRQMLNGLWVIVVLVFLVSLVYAIFFPDVRNFLYAGVPVFNALNQLLFLALMFSFINFLLIFIILAVPSLVRNRRFINPFSR